jgi:uncharacterized integral membrane protein
VWGLGADLLINSILIYTGLCYGKLEAAVLVFVIPSLLLGHLVFYLAHPFKEGKGKSIVWLVYRVVFEYVKEQ